MKRIEKNRSSGDLRFIYLCVIGFSHSQKVLEKIGDFIRADRRLIALTAWGELKGHVAGNTNLSKENESAFYLFIISKEKEKECLGRSGGHLKFWPNGKLFFQEPRG